MLKGPIFYACKKCWELENSLSHCILRNPSERAFNTKKNNFSIDSATAIDDDMVPSSLFANMSVDRGSRDGLKMDVPVIVKIQADPQDIHVRIGYIRYGQKGFELAPFSCDSLIFRL